MKFPIAHFWRAGILVVLVLALAGAGIGYLRYRHSGAEPPLIQDAQMDRELAAQIDQAANAVRQSPRSASAWGRLGMLYLAQKYFAEAQTCLLQAEQLDPTEVRWPYYLGIVLKIKDLPEAIRQLRRAVELSGEELDSPRLLLADGLMAEGEYDEAKAQFEHLLRLRPSHAMARLGLARVAYERGELSESLRLLKDCAGSVFAQKAAHTTLAMVYQRLGDPNAVEQELRLVHVLPEDTAWPDPLREELPQLAKDKAARLAEAGQLLDQNRVTEAIGICNELVRSYPDWDRAWQTLGTALNRHRDYTKAEQALRRALQLTPDDVPSLFSLGRAKLGQGDIPAAISYFRKVTHLKSDHAIAHLQLGQCLRKQGDRRGALEAVETAVRCQPFLGEAQRELGELFAENGDKAQALLHLRQALELDPTDKKAQKSLERVQHLGH